MTTRRFRPVFVESFPTPLESGNFYISLEFSTCAHLCACGCGEEAVTPLSPAQWAFTYDGENISVRPSIGNWALPCRSHYVINKGLVRWAMQFSDAQIASNRAHDRAALEPSNWPQYAVEPNARCSQAPATGDNPKRHLRSWWRRLRR